LTGTPLAEAFVSITVLTLALAGSAFFSSSINSGLALVTAYALVFALMSCAIILFYCISLLGNYNKTSFDFLSSFRKA